MLSPFILLLACSVLGWLYTKAAPQTVYADGAIYPARREDVAHAARCAFWLIVLILIWFGGLRTRMNDTANYIYGFYKIPSDFREALSETDWSLPNYPAFELYQIVLKSFVSKNGQALLLTSTAFAVISFACFFRKYSPDFGYSLFIFVAYTTYAASLAQMKQVLGTAIVIWAIPAHVEGKKLRAWLLVALAASVHLYAAVVAVGFFMEKRVWSGRVKVGFLIAAAIAMMDYERLADLIIAAMELIGMGRSWYLVRGSEGVSLPRVLTYMVVPFLAFACRRRLREIDNRYVTAFINICAIPAALGLVASRILAVIAGRMLQYFDIFICVSLPMVLHYGIRNERLRNAVKYLSIPLYCIFYFVYYSGFVSFRLDSLTVDLYRRTTLWQLLQNW